MTPSSKSVGILVSAAAVALGSVALSRAPAPAATPGEPAGAPHLAAALASSHVLRGSSETHLVVTVRAPRLPKDPPPVSVAVVLDRSGSMHGEKLEQARRAATELLGALGERDHFALVVYGTEVSTVFPLTRATEAAKSDAIRVIESIEDRGGTNLSGGLEAGARELDRADLEGVRRLVLISDGRANEGVVYRDQLADMARQTAQRGVSVTTVGVGLDFEEQTMTAVAVAGRGNYYYAERAADLSEMFATELRRVREATATAVRVRVVPAPGVELEEAYGYALADGVVEVADLHAGEERAVVFRLKVRSSEVGDAAIADVGLAMTDPSSGHHLAEHLAVAAAITDDAHAVQSGRDAAAVAAIEKARTARALEQATGLYERGDVGGARRLLEERRRDAARQAAAVGDAKLADEIDEVATEAEKNMAPAPASTAGKAGRKRNRKAAYDLLY